MQASFSLQGLGTALVTPFLADGSLDLDSLRSLVEFQIGSGIDFLVPCGSTGEAATLSEEETALVVRTVAEQVAGRIPIFAGSTHNSTAEAVRRAAALAGIDGVTGILSANPYYSKPNQRGQFLHFEAIALAVGKPVLLYNIPGRTAANLEAETTLRLAEIPNIVGVKESSGNLQQIGDVIAGAPAGFAVMAGDDHLAVPVMRAGGHGLISVAANAMPHTVAAIVADSRRADWPAAEAVAATAAALTAALFAEPNPAPIKTLLYDLGHIATPTLRLPMVPVEDALRTRLLALANAL